MDRASENRKKARKQFINGATLALFALVSVIAGAVFDNQIITAFTMFLGVVFALISFCYFVSAIILFLGQKALKTSDELSAIQGKRDIVWNEKNKRRCLNCGFVGGMHGYLNTTKAQALVLIGLLFFFVPGIIYLLFVSGKKICPKCQSLNNALP